MSNKPDSNKTDSKTSGQGQQFGILPHPAVRCRSILSENFTNLTVVLRIQKSNDPRDLEPPQPGAGLTSKPELEAFRARGPFVPNREALINAGPPAVSFRLSLSSRTSIDNYVTD